MRTLVYVRWCVCDMLGTLGLPGLCVPCAGSDYCLYVEAHFDESAAADIEVNPDPLGECIADEDDGASGDAG